MQGVLVKLESRRVYLAAREEIHWPFLVLDLDVLVVADQEAGLG